MPSLKPDAPAPCTSLKNPPRDHELCYIPRITLRQRAMRQVQEIQSKYDPSATIVVHPGKCLDFLRTVPDAVFQLIITSPPYNIGKEYERRLDLRAYLDQQASVIRECVAIPALKPEEVVSAAVWETYVVRVGAVVPLDTVLYPIFTDLGLRMRNRIVWHFEHGLHCSRRFSGRYETVMWFTAGDDYVFNLDPVRVPQKYPGKKHFKGPRGGGILLQPVWARTRGTFGSFPTSNATTWRKDGASLPVPRGTHRTFCLILDPRGGYGLRPVPGRGNHDHCRHSARSPRPGNGNRIQIRPTGPRPDPQPTLGHPPHPSHVQTGLQSQDRRNQLIRAPWNPDPTSLEAPPSDRREPDDGQP